MSKRIRTPQDDKDKSLAKDCRNAYGENNKFSRKNIAKRKQMSRQGERRQASQLLAVNCQSATADDEWVAKEVASLSGPPDPWRKSPDLPLGAVLKRKRAKRKATDGA